MHAQNKQARDAITQSPVLSKRTTRIDQPIGDIASNDWLGMYRDRDPCCSGGSQSFSSLDSSEISSRAAPLSALEIGLATVGPCGDGSRTCDPGCSSGAPESWIGCAGLAAMAWTTTPKRKAGALTAFVLPVLLSSCSRYLAQLPRQRQMVSGERNLWAKAYWGNGPYPDYKTSPTWVLEYLGGRSRSPSALHVDGC